MDTARLSVVVPAYNEAGRLGASLPRLVDRLTGAELIVVDDGSTDDTADLAKQLLQDMPAARVLGRPHAGKGAAVRAGVLDATRDVVVFMDADLATDLNDLEPLLTALDHADIAIGSRRTVGAEVRDGERSRAAIAWTGNAIVRGLTPLRMRDTQCGFKAFARPTAQLLFGMARTDGFGFDVEILTIAHRLGLRVAEVPVSWTAVEGSHVRPVADSLGTMAEVARISWRWRRRVARAQATERGWSPDGTAPRPAV